MSNQMDLVQVPDTNEPAVARHQALTLSHDEALVMIARASMDPTVDVAKMQALMAMRQELRRETAKEAYQRAMAALQARKPRITKDGRIEVNGQVRSRYATLENIDAQMAPLLEEFGFAVSSTTLSNEDGKMQTVRSTVMHREGHSEAFEVRLPLDTSGSKNPTQGVGSTVSYGKRYNILNAFNIVVVGEDDDGQIKVGTITKDQALSIEDCLATVDGITREALLKWASEAAKTAITKVPDIPAYLYVAAMRSFDKQRGAK